ncbi:Rieske (2Fe-2S) protein [Fodinicola feengrottensis]|uniref:Rieske (2Fe-2S) protein n=1 Tax=Fodinicola feengrottensis TaxID=435914 RepID=UPI0024432A09|nr:Rieske (2Fe-2S) protein [Fodinicola feengrottensis]
MPTCCAGRRPRTFGVEPGDEAYVRTAIELRAAGSADAGPSEDFVESLHDRLSKAMAEPDPVPAPAAKTGRRRFVQAAAVAAGSAVVGAGAEFVLTRPPTLADAPIAAQTLTPNVGEWRTVAGSHEIGDGGVKPFDLGVVTGFVERTSGKLRAVSGVCTHLGCRLVLDNAQKQLNCPCHRASFAVTGEVLRHQLPITLPPLPRLAVREIDGLVQVFAPHV